MSETEKKNEGQKCCCCQCWKAIFIAIALLAIGAAFGHVMTMKCCPMMGPWGGGHGMKAFWDRGEREREGGWEHKFQGEKEVRGEHEEKGWFGHKADIGKCKPSLSEPNKATCPMMEKKEGKAKKD